MKRAVIVFAAIVAGCGDPARVSIAPQSSDEIVLTIEVRAEAPAETPSVAAFTVFVDGRSSHEVLVVPGSGLPSYETLVGPLSRGEHSVEVRPSSHWPAHPGLRVIGTTARTITAADPSYDLVRFAPAIALRPDTVGTANDLPMLMYGEEARDAGRVLRYTTIFTNEDGGTETEALFARWGRACDIELAYELRLDPSGQTIAETFQGPDHETMSFNGVRVRDHPILAVATRNNMFMDNRVIGVLVRPVPVAFRSGAATRESVLDDRPWLQRLTARELAAEKKPFDPRDFVYLEANVQVGESAATAAWVEQADGTRVSSDRGDERLRVTRDGWVRVAVPLVRHAAVAAAGWSCLPRKLKADQAPGLKPGAPTCQIQSGRVFRLSDDFQVRDIAVDVRASAGPTARRGHAPRRRRRRPGARN